MEPKHQLTKEQYVETAEILEIINRETDKYLHLIETPQDANEVAMVWRMYFQRKRFFLHDISMDTDLITSLLIEAFQLEHGYVQTQLTDGQFSQESINVLNEQTSTGELTYTQLLD